MNAAEEAAEEEKDWDERCVGKLTGKVKRTVQMRMQLNSGRWAQYEMSEWCRRKDVEISRHSVKPPAQFDQMKGDESLYFRAPSTGNRKWNRSTQQETDEQEESVVQLVVTGFDDGAIGREVYDLCVKNLRDAGFKNWERGVMGWSMMRYMEGRPVGKLYLQTRAVQMARGLEWILKDAKVNDLEEERPLRVIRSNQEYVATEMVRGKRNAKEARFDIEGRESVIMLVGIWQDKPWMSAGKDKEGRNGREGDLCRMVHRDEPEMWKTGSEFVKNRKWNEKGRIWKG